MRTNRVLIIACVAAALAVAGSLSAATSPAVHKDIPAKLAKEAKISLDAATATALAKVPGGEMRSVELEKEHGKLIYSFDIAVPGKPGIEEVNVSAITGKVVSQEHESAKEEAKEEKKEHSKPPVH